MHRTTIKGALAALTLTASLASAQTPDYTAVDKALGRPGTDMPGNVRRYAFPRSDLSITANGVQLKTGFAASGWLAFRPTSGSDVMMMGDLVLLEPEIGAVIAKLQSAGITQTAIHNHLQGDSPHIMFMHVMGHGQAATLAAAARAALELTKTPMAAPAAAANVAIDLDTAAMNKAIGAPGRVVGGILQYSIPRVETVSAAGHEVPPSMGTSTPINFQPTGGGKAAITGDYVMLASEVTDVIKTLTENGINVVSIHSHWTDESPRLTMAHFWANDDAVKLAKALGAALDKTNSKRTK